MKNHFLEASFLTVVAIGFAVGLSLISGCQSTPPAQPAAEAPPAPPSRVVLRPGDVVEVKLPYASQFNETQTIRPDGIIQLQLIGVVVAQGKTPEELGAELTHRYAGQLQHPEVAVIVRSLQERRIYVGGAVNKPGMIEMPGQLSALEAIMQAGGFNTEKAETGSVIVVRSRDGKQYGYALDFKKPLTGQEDQPFYLEPRDIIYVPQTRIANVDQWIDQHLYKVLPPVSIGIPMY